MPRASWKGFLRLSLVSCPIYLSPATTRTKSIRLHQVWQPKSTRALSEDLEEEEQPYQDAGRSYDNEIRGDARLELPAPARIALLPHDPHTGEEIEREEVVKGYEYERGQFVTFTAEELKALDVESSKIIDLETFVPRAEVDPVYFSTPYYVYPDGPIAVETFRVIGAAMAEAGAVGIGRVTLSRRERLVMVEPRDAGMVLITLRASEEVRAAAFAKADTDIDADMVAIAETIIKRRSGRFDPATFRDRYQEALRELIEAATRPAPASEDGVQLGGVKRPCVLTVRIAREPAKPSGAVEEPGRRQAATRLADDERRDERAVRRRVLLHQTLQGFCHPLDGMGRHDLKSLRQLLVGNGDSALREAL